jgi:hypothetical protein
MRTPLQAYQHVLARFRAGKLGAMKPTGGCVYQEEGVDKNCAVGCLFTQAQLDDIKARGLNSSAGVTRLANDIGLDNIEAVTGLKLADLMEMQGMHDKAFYSKNSQAVFESWLKVKIANESNS